jgi:hypothetical protein
VQSEGSKGSEESEESRVSGVSEGSEDSEGSEASEGSKCRRKWEASAVSDGSRGKLGAHVTVSQCAVASNKLVMVMCR